MAELWQVGEGRKWVRRSMAQHEIAPIATKDDPGVVQPGDDFNITDEGVLSINPSSTNLPQAATDIPKALGTAAVGTSEKYAREDHVHPESEDSGGIAGMIVAFSGTFSGRNPIPRGSSVADTSWVLCDGGSDGKGGTVPDLRNRMIMGAGSSYAVDSTGGSATHSHTLSGSTSSASVSGSVSGNVGSHTLTTSEMPKHTHSYTGASALGPYATGIVSGGTGNVGANTSSSAGGGSSHTHSLSSVSVSLGSHSHTNSGSAASATALPPYYALSYIIKVT